MSKKISYAVRDFSGLRQELVNLTKEYYPELVSNTNDASIYSVLLDLNASVTDNLHYHKEDKTLSAEMSDLPPGFSTKHTIIVYNPKTGNTKTFTHYGNDVDGSGEDVYGYKYRSQDGIELLIIND